MEAIESYEQLVRKIGKHGNSKGIYVPHYWKEGQYVLVRTLSPKETILNTLAPYMENIIGVYLYGSYARDEQVGDSDIDILIIADKKLKIPKENGLDITIMTPQGIEKSIEEEPLFAYSTLKEAKTILNPYFLESLRRKINLKNRCDSFYKNAKSMMQVISENIKNEVDKESAVYSLILRLRGVYLIGCYRKSMTYTNRGFVEWLLKQGISEEKLGQFYSVYRAVRDDRKIPEHGLTWDDISALYKLTKEKLRIK